MRRFLILYATREGHTHRIADYLADVLRSAGFMPDVVDVAHAPSNLFYKDYAGAILAASVHKQTHEKEMTRFVKNHLSQLGRIPTAFLSVSLSQAGAEDESAPGDRRARAACDAKKMIDAFLADTGWQPSRTQAVAGALMYSKYNFLIRHILKNIAKKAGGDTDTSRDYQYTNWSRLRDFVNDMVSSLDDYKGVPDGRSAVPLTH